MEIPMNKHENKQENKHENEHELDLRGVACPMNFVKTRLFLDKVAAGDVLNVLLDDGEPIESVSASVGAEGHLVERQVKCPEGHYLLSIRKV
jgi:sulfite reductase (ferredoxin)